MLQTILNSLCPPDTSHTRRRLCAILVTEDRPADDEAREQLRQFMRNFKFSRERVTFAYIYRDKQDEFLNSLTQGGYQFLTVSSMYRAIAQLYMFRWGVASRISVAHCHRLA